MRRTTEGVAAGRLRLCAQALGAGVGGTYEGQRPCHQGGRRSGRWGKERKGRGGTFPLHLSPFMADFRLDLGNYLLLSIISFPHSRRGKNTPESLWGKETQTPQLFSARGAGALQSCSDCRPRRAARSFPTTRGSLEAGPRVTPHCLVPDTGRQVGGSKGRYPPQAGVKTWSGRVCRPRPWRAPLTLPRGTQVEGATSASEE